MAMQHRGSFLMISLTVLLAASGCSRNQNTAASAGEASADAASSAPEQASPGAVVGTENKSGSALAYEHVVQIRMPARQIASNVAAVRTACMSERFGPCSVLAEEMGAGEWPTGAVTMRVAPKAVQPLVAMASAGGEIAQRSTHAEDLADAVRDNGLRRARLELQHQKLTELVAHRDMKIEDLISINDRLSDLEAQLQLADQESAQQKRRIETNLLTLNFNSAGVTAESSRIGQALRGLTTVWDNSVAALITILGAALPFLLLGGFIFWIIRRVKRRTRTVPPSV